MISALPDWSFEVHGLEIRLSPLDARTAGLLSYVEHLAPIAPPRELAGRLDGFAVVSSETFRTVEDERASLTILDGHIRRVPARRFLGQVFLDDHYAEIAGACLDPAQHTRFAATARDLLRNDRHFLGDRRRRFEHAPPAGWTARPLGSRLHRLWTSPDGAMTLLVGAALPHRESSIDEVLVAARRTHALVDPQSLALLAPGGLHAEAWALCDQREPARRRLVAVVHDDRYVYPIHVEHTPGELAAAVRVLSELIATIEPLRPRQPASTASLAHWAD